LLHTTGRHSALSQGLAELILRATTDPIPGLIPRHAQLEGLQVLGFEILNPDPHGRRVRRNGRTFLEGRLESMVTELRDGAQEALGQGRPAGTARRRKNLIAYNIAAFFAVRITVRKCVGLYGLART
jgi:hypothetical protein